MASDTLQDFQPVGVVPEEPKRKHEAGSLPPGDFQPVGIVPEGAPAAPEDTGAVRGLVRQLIPGLEQGAAFSGRLAGETAQLPDRATRAALYLLAEHLGPAFGLSPERSRQFAESFAQGIGEAQQKGSPLTRAGSGLEEIGRAAAAQAAQTPATTTAQQVVRGLATLPTSLPGVLPYVETLGPVGGLAASSAVAAPPGHRLAEAAKGAVIGTAFPLTQGLSPLARLLAVGATGAGVEAASGGDYRRAVSSGIVAGVLAALDARRVRMERAQADQARQIAARVEAETPPAAAPPSEAPGPSAPSPQGGPENAAAGEPAPVAIPGFSPASARDAADLISEFGGERQLAVSEAFLRSKEAGPDSPEGAHLVDVHRLLKSETPTDAIMAAGRAAAWDVAPSVPERAPSSPSAAPAQEAAAPGAFVPVSETPGGTPAEDLGVSTPPAPQEPSWLQEPIPETARVAGAPAGAPKLPAEIAGMKRGALRRVLDELRTGRRPELNGLAKYPILAHLRGLGGVDPKSALAADLRAMDVPRIPGLFRKGGIGDLAAVDFADDPLFHGNVAREGESARLDANTVLGLIDQELRGNPLRSPDEQARILDRQAPREELARTLDELGIDLKTTPDNEVMAALLGASKRSRAVQPMLERVVRSESGLAPEVTRQGQAAEVAQELHPQPMAAAVTPGSRWLAPQDVPVREGARIPENPVRPERVLVKLAKVLDVPIQEGRLRSEGAPNRTRGVRGYFLPRSEVLRIRDFGDIQAATHELGHALADRYPELRKLYEDPGHAAQELAAVSHDASRPEEGFADFVRLWFTNPAEAKARAPRVFDAFEGFARGLPKKQRRAILGAQADVEAYFAQGAAATLYSKIGPRQASPRDVLTGATDRFRQAALDDLYGIYHAEEVAGLNPNRAGSGYQDFRLLRGLEGWRLGLLRYGKPVPAGGEGGGFRFEGPGLLDILAPVSRTKADLREFEAYAVARRAREIEGHGKTSGFSRAEIDAGLRLTTPARQRAFRQLREFQDNALDFAEREGLITPESRRAISDLNQEYGFAFYREGPFDRPRGLLRTMGGSTGIEKMQGSTRNLRSPLEAMLDGPMRIYRAALENRARRQLVDELRNVEGGGRFLDRIGAGTRLVRVARDSAMQALRRELQASGMSADQAERALAPVESKTPDVLTVFGGGTTPDGNVLTVLRDGRPEFYEVFDRLLYDSLRAIHRNRTRSWLVRVLNAFRRVKQAGVTATPDFWFRNVFRDPIQSRIMTEAGFRAVQDTLRGMRHALTHDETYREFLANFGGFGGFRENDPIIRREIAYHARRSEFNPLHLVLHPSDFIRALDRAGMTFELAPRLGQYVRARDLGIGRERAAFLGRDISTDFAVRGSSDLVATLGDTIPFFHAAMASFEKLDRTAWRNPETRAKVLARIGALAALSVGLRAWNDQFKAYRDLPDWDKFSYWHYMIPKPGGGVLHLKQPKTWEVGSIATLAEQTASRLWSADPEWHRLPGDALKILDQNFVFELPEPVGSAAEQLANREFFTGRPIVPGGQDELAPFLQYTSRTSPALVKAAEAARDVPGLRKVASPERAQALLYGLFGTSAMYGQALLDAVFGDGSKPATPLDQRFVVRSFYEQPGKYDRFRSEFYDTLREQEQTIRSLGEVIKQGRPDLVRGIARRAAPGMLSGVGDAEQANHVLELTAREVEKRGDLTAEQKRAALDRIHAAQDKLMEQSVRAYRAAGGG